MRSQSKADSTDIISPDIAGTLSGLFQERVRRSPDAIAYRFYDDKRQAWVQSTWAEMGTEVARWQAELEGEGLQPGDCVAVMLGNCREWVMFEQAALGLGLVVVPLYVNDRAENVAYILDDANVKVLLIGGPEQGELLQDIKPTLAKLTRLLTLHPVSQLDCTNIREIADWLPPDGEPLRVDSRAPNELATIVYTSGTTGRPKGVMLSHYNILWNAYSSMQSVKCYPDDLFLSFLPLSHTLERTGGYYLPMMAGSTVAYARSIPQLAEDLVSIRPTLLMSVPRIFEKVAIKIRTTVEEKGGLTSSVFEAAVNIGWRHFLHQQGRSPWHPSLLLWPVLKKKVADEVINKLGGRIRVAVCGGAPLSEPVAKTFIGLGLPLVQGYGLTESSPVISVNRLDDNDPASVGTALNDVEVKIGENEELLARSPGIMLGYWNRPDATKETVDEDGWLHTGDKAKIERGHIYITGRIKDIIVLANGEKVPPADMEAAIIMNPLFEHVMIVGEGKPYLSALVVLNNDKASAFAAKHGLHGSSEKLVTDEDFKKAVLDEISKQICGFPGYAKVRHVAIEDEPWTVENGLITPTLKLRRNRILDFCQKNVASLYSKR